MHRGHHQSLQLVPRSWGGTRRASLSRGTTRIRLWSQGLLLLRPQDEEGAAPSSAAAPDPRRPGPVLSRMCGAGVAVGTHTARSHPYGRAAVLPVLGLFPNCLPYCWPFRQRERGLPLRGEAQWPLPKGLQSSRRGPSLPGRSQAHLMLVRSRRGWADPSRAGLQRPSSLTGAPPNCTLSLLSPRR